MTLPDYSYTLNGLTMGAGTDYDVLDLSGLGATPPATNDLPALNGGVIAARDIAAPRTAVFNVEIWGTPGTDLAGKLGAFATAWKTPSNTDVHLGWHLEGQTDDRYLIGRSRGWSAVFDYAAARGLIRVTGVTFFSPAGIIYDAATNLAVDI